MLADEPTANLDHETAYRIINLMRRLRDDFGTSFVFSTHDPKIMGEAEVTFELEDGRLDPAGCGGCFMIDILKIAARNLLRYKRRTLLTALLITVGLVAVLLFIAVAGSFKSMMVAQFTDSMVGHLQVHRRGYVGAMESLPVDRNMRPRMLVKLYETLDAADGIEAWSPRVKLMAMFSNFANTTSIRLNGVDPVRESATVPWWQTGCWKAARSHRWLSRVRSRCRS